MSGVADPNNIIAMLGVALLVLAGCWQLIRWVDNARPTPEPWSAEVEASLQAQDATPICHRCLTPHSDEAWFCAHCGSAVGTYNNLMPYVQIFSAGEVLRNGATDKMRANPLTIGGYLLYSLGQYLILAPIYWFFLFRNLRRCETPATDEPVENEQ